MKCCELEFPLRRIDPPDTRNHPQGGVQIYPKGKFTTQNHEHKNVSSRYISSTWWIRQQITDCSKSHMLNVKKTWWITRIMYILGRGDWYTAGAAACRPASVPYLMRMLGIHCNIPKLYLHWLKWDKNNLCSWLKVMKSQNEYMKLSHCPKYEQNIREISALEGYID